MSAAGEFAGVAYIAAVTGASPDRVANLAIQIISTIPACWRSCSWSQRAIRAFQAEDDHPQATEEPRKPRQPRKTAPPTSSERLPPESRSA